MQKSFQLILIAFLLNSFSSVNAIENISFGVKQIYSEDWHLKDVRLVLSDIQEETQQLALSIKQLVLTSPFEDVVFFDIHCSEFSWQVKNIVCRKGRSKLRSKKYTSSSFDFSFSLAEQGSQITINKLKLANGSISLIAKEQGQDWQIKINAKNLSLAKIVAFLPNNQKIVDELTQGLLDAAIQLRGNVNGSNYLLFKSRFKNISLQAQQGTIATETLGFNLDLTAIRNNKCLAKRANCAWTWKKNSHINKGELYIDPVYLDIKDTAIDMSATGKLAHNSGLIIQQAKFTHSAVVDVDIGGLIKFQPEFNINKADITINISDLNQFSLLYFSPFIEETGFEGFKLKGFMQSKIKLHNSAIKELFVSFSHLNVDDEKQRLRVENAQGNIYWSNNPDFLIPSTIHWKQLKIKAIPVEAGKLKILAKQKSIKLLQASVIPLLGGKMEIKKFNWQHTLDNEPKISFEGGIHNLSLEQLSSAFDWLPLSGNISGYIPRVDYHNKTLTIDGELKVSVFDGEIKINKLASSGMFTDFSKFYMDMEIENLDLHALTQKIEMGNIEGRLSGFINNLYLENWQPVTFLAWIGTPENDNSRHRISQKAVENIASIGGGGAADAISKGFLRFFDTFGYDRIGFGCYLHQGVCQIMGVESTEQGYYIIKGGGVPRIDVIGYNPRVNWDVLMQRLTRITSTEEVLIE